MSVAAGGSNAPQRIVTSPWTRLRPERRWSLSGGTDQLSPIRPQTRPDCSGDAERCDFSSTRRRFCSRESALTEGRKLPAYRCGDSN
jgi:hypothetical protein